MVPVPVTAGSAASSPAPARRGHRRRRIDPRGRPGPAMGEPDADPRHRDRRPAAAGVGLPRAADARPQVRLAVAHVPRPAVAVHAGQGRPRSVRDRPVRLGLARHRYEKFGPWGANPPRWSRAGSAYWKQQGRMLLRVTPTYSFARLVHPGPGRAGRHRGSDASRGRTSAAPTPTISGCASASGTSGTSRSAASRAGRSFTSAWASTRTPSSARARSGAGEAEYPIAFYGLTDNQFRPPGAAGNMAFHYYPLPFLRFEVLGMVGSLSGPAIATRPVAILDFGWLKLKGGVECQHIPASRPATRPTTRRRRASAAPSSSSSSPTSSSASTPRRGPSEHRRHRVSGPQRQLHAHQLRRVRERLQRQSRHPLLFGVGSLFTRNVDQNDIVAPDLVDKYWLYQSFVAAQYVLEAVSTSSWSAATRAATGPTNDPASFSTTRCTASGCGFRSTSKDTRGVDARG